jgi:hypothetical protein
MIDCRRRRPALLRWLPWLLALALLQAQALGQWHRIAHGGGPALAAEATASADGHQVFGHVAGDEAQCRLYDAVGTAAGPWSAPCLAPAVPLAQVEQAADVQPLAARTLRLYQARAPPQA